MSSQNPFAADNPESQYDGLDEKHVNETERLASRTAYDLEVKSKEAQPVATPANSGEIHTPLDETLKGLKRELEIKKDLKRALNELKQKMTVEQSEIQNLMGTVKSISEGTKEQQSENNAADQEKILRLRKIKYENMEHSLKSYLGNAREGVEHRRYDHIALIKDLVKSFMKEAYLDGEFEIFSRIIQNIVEFSKFAHSSDADDIAASIFKLNATDMQHVVQALAREDYHYLTWCLIEDVPFMEYSDKHKEVQHFKNNVCMALNQGELLRDCDKILADIKTAYANKELESFEYHLKEIDDKLKDAFSRDDAATFAAIIAGKMDIARKLQKDKCFNYFKKIFNLSPSDIAFERQIFEDSSRQRYAIWHCIEAVRLKGCAKTMPWTNENINRFKQDVYKAITGQVNIVSELNALEKMIRCDLEQNRVMDLEIDAQEMYAILIQAFRNQDATTFAWAIEACEQLTQEADQLGHTNFASQLLGFNFYDNLGTDCLDKVLRNVGKNKRNVGQFLLIENLYLEDDLSVVNHDTVNDVQHFKQQVYQVLCAQKNLLLSSEQLCNDAKEMMDTRRVKLNALQTWGDEVQALLLYAYQQKNKQLLTDTIKMVVSVAQKYYDAKKQSAILQVLDINVLDRDNFVRHLYERDADSAARVLIELIFRNNRDHVFFQWIYQEKGAPFKLEIYQLMGIMPPEITNAVIGYQLAEFGQYHYILDWLMNRQGKKIDLTDPMTQNYLGGFSIMPYLEEIKSYLKTMEDSDQSEKIGSLLTTLSMMYRLAHRFGLSGEANVQGVKIDLEGSFISVILEELKASHTRFRKTENYEAIIEQLRQLFIQNGSTLSQTSLFNIEYDIRNTSLFTSPDQFENHLKTDGVVNMPVHLKTDEPNMAHYINMSFMGDFCFIADNSRSDKDSGIRIFKVTKSDVIPQILITLQKTHRANTGVKFLHETFEAQMEEQLGLEECAPMLPFRCQKTGNCGMASCGKMILRCTALGRFYQEYLKSGKDKEEAMILAKTACKQYSKMFGEDDRERFLQSIIQTFKSPDNVPTEVIELLAEIDTRSKNRPIRQPIVHFLEHNFTFKKDVVEDAHIRMRERIQQAILKSILPEGKEVSEQALLEIVEHCMQEYLTNRTDGESKELEYTERMPPNEVAQQIAKHKARQLFLGVFDRFQKKPFTFLRDLHSDLYNQKHVSRDKGQDQSSYDKENRYNRCTPGIMDTP